MPARPRPRPRPDPSLVALLRSRPQIIERILAEHVDNGAGHCRACSNGTETRRYPYPCAVRLAADEALRRIEEDIGGAGSRPGIVVIDAVAAPPTHLERAAVRQRAARA